MRIRGIAPTMAVSMLLAGFLIAVPNAVWGLSPSPAAGPDDPVANAGGPYNVDEGAQVTFSGDASDPQQEASTLTYEWDFEFDGSFGVSSSGVNLTSPTNTYADNGTFTIALRVTDSDENMSLISTAIVTVANVPPNANVGGPYTVDEGTAIAFSGSATDPGEDTLTYEWDFDYDGVNFEVESSGDGLTNPSTTYTNDGEKRVALRVRDKDGGISVTKTTLVTINNVPPSANSGTSYTGDEGAAITFNGSATDPGVNDTLVFEWDFNFQSGEFSVDQSGEGLTAPTYTYPDNEQFTVALRVRDDDTVSTPATASVVVNNVPPTANAGGPYQGIAGSAITFGGSATDPGNDTLTYEWDFDYDGTIFDTVGAADSGVDLTTPTHSYTDDGTFTVALRVRDDDGGISAVATTQIMVGPLTEPTPTPSPTPTPTPTVSSPPPPPPPPPPPSSSGSSPIPTPTPTPTVIPTVVLSPTPLPVATPQLGREQTVTIDTVIQPSAPEISHLQLLVLSATGQFVTIDDAPLEVTTSDQGLSVDLGATGVTEDKEIVGDINVTLGNLTLETTDGHGTATIALDEGLSVEGNATLVATEAGLRVEIEAPVLRFVPKAPVVSTLNGGSESVTEIRVSFDVVLIDLPDGASLSVRFAKDASELVADADTIFQVAAQSAGGVIQDPAEDIAFVVAVSKSIITSQDLGANTITATVSKRWFAQKQGEGKEIIITKIDDQGNLFTAPASCIVTGEIAKCTARFAGAAGGFSTFALMAIVPVVPAIASTLMPTLPTPTPTVVAQATQMPTPIATPTQVVPFTPTPVPTPTSTPTAAAMQPSTRTPPSTPTPLLSPLETAVPSLSDGGSPVGIVALAVLVLAILGAAGAYYLRVIRRDGGVASAGK